MIGKSVSSVARGLDQAEQILERLRYAGFSRNDISVLFSPLRPKGEGAIEAALAWLGVAPGVPAQSLVAGGPTLVKSFQDEPEAFSNVIEALRNFGIQEREARGYDEAIRTGAIWFSVIVADQDGVERAQWIFEDAGAEQICTTRESRILERRTPDAAEPDPNAKRVRRKRFGRLFFS
jgi:hypothetical protein